MYDIGSALGMPEADVARYRRTAAALSELSSLKQVGPSSPSSTSSFSLKPGCDARLCVC
jgi:hypothetical protein